MRVTLERRDLVVLLGLAAATAFAISLGAHPALAAEVAVAAAMLLLVAVLLRAAPDRDTRPVERVDEDPRAAARRSVEGALRSPWGVDGRFRRVVRDVVDARLATQEQDLDAVRETLPPELLAVLDGRWDHDRGLTTAELERILTAVEELGS